MSDAESLHLRITELEADNERLRALLVARERRLSSSSIALRAIYLARDARARARLRQRIKGQRRRLSRSSVSAMRQRLGRRLLTSLSVDKILAAEDKRLPGSSIRDVLRTADLALSDFVVESNQAALAASLTRLNESSRDLESRLDGHGDVIGRAYFEAHIVNSLSTREGESG